MPSEPEIKALIDCIERKLKESYPDSSYQFRVFWDYGSKPDSEHSAPLPLCIEFRVGGVVEYSKFSHGWTTMLLERNWHKVVESINGMIAEMKAPF